MRLERHGEGLLNVRGQVGNVTVFPLKLPDGNVPAFMT